MASLKHSPELRTVTFSYSMLELQLAIMAVMLLDCQRVSTYLALALTRHAFWQPCRSPPCRPFCLLQL